MKQRKTKHRTHKKKHRKQRKNRKTHRRTGGGITDQVVTTPMGVMSSDAYKNPTETNPSDDFN